MNRVITVTLVSLVFFINFAYSEEPYVPKENEEYYGTWVNDEYDNVYTWTKWEIKPDGTWTSYSKVQSEYILVGKGTYTLTAKWKDDKGGIWYKMTNKNDILEVNGYGLLHISDSGSTMEAAYGRSDYPTKIDPKKSFPAYGGIHYKK